MHLRIIRACFLPSELLAPWMHLIALLCFALLCFALLCSALLCCVIIVPSADLGTNCVGRSARFSVAKARRNSPSAVPFEPCIAHCANYAIDR